MDDPSGVHYNTATSEDQPGFFTSSNYPQNIPEQATLGDQLRAAAGQSDVPVDLAIDNAAGRHGLMKDYTAAQNRSDQGEIQAQPAFDPMALLNPKAAPKRAASDAAGERAETSDTSSVGQVNLVERLHNIHHRTASPAKRAKTALDNKIQQRPLHAPGGSTLTVQPQVGGPLPPSAPPSQSSAIDLTMSDDEEVKVIKDNGSQTICIGRVKQVYVQTFVVPFPDPAKYKGNNGTQSRIKVSFRRQGVQQKTNIIMVVDPTGKEFGRIDLKTAQGLAPLLDSAKNNGLMWIASTEPRRKMPSEGPPGTPLSTLVALTLQLYCPRKIARNIGRFLDSRNIKLGDPVIEIAKFDYFNPQTAQAFTVKEAADPEFSSSYQKQHASAPPMGYHHRTAEEIREEVLNVFDSLEDSSNLPRRKQSSRIKTPLLKHQEQALYFMWDKEREWIEGMEARTDALWKPKFHDNGRKYWVHVITGQKAERPESIRGGILADEMGLGKTLSILSLVMDEESVAAAKAFAQKVPPLVHGQRRHFINSRATLLVCPLSTMVNWKSQIQDHFSTENAPQWIYYHGPDRKVLSPQKVADNDIVITTYHMISADIQNPKSALNTVNWFRIVLDEAHQIRSGTTKQATSVYQLASLRKWAVTGTPVQNRLEDMHALFRFLEFKPFSATAGFNEHIIRPFKEANEDVVPKLQLIVRSITLRRLKEGNIGLPSRTDEIVRLQFSESEARLHKFFEQESSRQVNAVTAGGKMGGTAYARILKAILYLRLICAHGRDLLPDEALKLTEGMSAENPLELTDDDEQVPVLTRKAAYEMLDLLSQTNTDVCLFTDCQQGRRGSIWETEASDSGSETSDEEGGSGDALGFMTQCYHVVCPKDGQRLEKAWDAQAAQHGQGSTITCQFCDQRIRPVLFPLTRSDYFKFQDEQERLRKDPKLAKKVGAYTGPHTKTIALLEELRKNAEESAANPQEAPVKSVVFSCWTTHLDLIAIALDNHGYKYTRLDGRMNRKSRDRALTAFANDPSIHIILVSIGAGGLGLNLTSANKVYVMEPQFNPAAEAQAVDRVHRLGQTRPVTILRFVMDGSFEEKMLDLQRKKRALANLTMASSKKNKEETAKQKLEDLKSLFR